MFISQVAPFTGAWIETLVGFVAVYSDAVAPFTGAWIETLKILAVEPKKSGRTLHGCVD